MADEQFTKNRIIQETGKRLAQYGYAKLIIDELAADLGISKKTLYKFFPTKKDLIRTVALGIFQEKTAEITVLFHDHELEYTVKLKRLIEFVSTLASNIGPILIDLQKNAPEIVAELLELRQKLIVENFRNFLRDGLTSGILRNDVNPEITLLIFINVINSIATPQVLAELPFSLKETVETIIRVIFNGILNEGHKI